MSASEFSSVLEQYKEFVVESTEASVSAVYQQNVLGLIERLTNLWKTFLNSGALSIEVDDLNDLSTSTLALLSIPYYLGDLHQRIVTAPTTQPSEASKKENGVGRPLPDSGRSSHLVTQNSAIHPLSALSRQQLLVLTKNHFKTFLVLLLRISSRERNSKSTTAAWPQCSLVFSCEQPSVTSKNFQFVTEKDVALVFPEEVDLDESSASSSTAGLNSLFSSSVDRTFRVQISKKHRELEQKVQQLTAKLSFERARRTRWDREFGREEGVEGGLVRDQEGMDVMSAATERNQEAHREKETADDTDETLRELCLVRLQYCAVDSLSQCLMLNRELEMFQALSVDEQRALSERYQQGIQWTRERRNQSASSRGTYTILPGGSIVPGMVSPQVVSELSNQSRHAAEMMMMQPAMSSLALSTDSVGGERGGRGGPMSLLKLTSDLEDLPDREKIRVASFQQRNMPTATLAEFAEGEMATMQQAMKQAERMNQRKKEEDERLNEDDKEERERKKQSQWSDWKDDNPPIGFTAKGNYS